ncbi:MAG: GSCFA domain-containing protein [Bacteroidales bacterium]
MDFTTKINIPAVKDRITYKNSIVMLGSCFANEIGQYLKDYQFNIMINPFGTLYNPSSIANSIERLSTCTLFTANDVIESNNIFTSFYHHSSISQASVNEFLERANNELINNSELFHKADTVIITLGTAYIYRHIARNIVVTNCHKIKASEFERKLLSVKECVIELEKIITAVKSFTQTINTKLIFTVSPIRHIKDGAHKNQISKATLMVAIEEIQQKYDFISYFPAYEIMMDELRDYRFYASDMLHPSPLAIEYIFERFKETFIEPHTQTTMQEAIRLTKAQNHRPLFPDSKEYAKFKLKLEQDLENFNKHIK